MFEKDVVLEYALVLFWDELFVFLLSSRALIDWWWASG